MLWNGGGFTWTPGARSSAKIALRRYQDRFVVAIANLRMIGDMGVDVSLQMDTRRHLSERWCAKTAHDVENRVGIYLCGDKFAQVQKWCTYRTLDARSIKILIPNNSTFLFIYSQNTIQSGPLNWQFILWSKVLFSEWWCSYNNVTRLLPLMEEVSGQLISDQLAKTSSIFLHWALLLVVAIEYWCAMTFNTSNFDDVFYRVIVSLRAVLDLSHTKVFWLIFVEIWIDFFVLYPHFIFWYSPTTPFQRPDRFCNHLVMSWTFFPATNISSNFLIGSLHILDYIISPRKPSVYLKS